MKAISLTLLSLILGVTAFAEPYVVVEISCRFEGFDRSKYAEFTRLDHGARKEMLKKFKNAGLGEPIDTGNPAGIGTKSTGNVLAAYTLRTDPGQLCQIESMPETQVPKTPNGKKSVNFLTLEFLPVVKDGKITLSGKSILRRHLRQEAVQPLGAISIATHETFFNGAVEDGKELIVAVGDGPKDKARIILAARLVTLGPSGTAAK